MASYPLLRASLLPMCLRSWRRSRTLLMVGTHQANLPVGVSRSSGLL